MGSRNRRIARHRRNRAACFRALERRISVVKSSGHLLVVLTLLATSFALAAGKSEPKSQAKPQRQVIGYFTEGGAKSGKYTVKDLIASGAAERLTEINYAFGRVADDQCQIPDPETALKHSYSAAESVDGTDDPAGDTQLRGTFHQLQELKRKYPKVRIVISFGGWGQSDGFSSAVEPEHLKEFVRGCVDVFILGHFAPGIEAPGVFDGIDIDWEYPVEGGVTPGRPEDTANFTAMAEEFRHRMDAVRPGLLLTAALPAPAELYKNFDLKRIAASMDFLSIMAYDLHWDSEPVTYLHSPLFHDPKDPSKPPFDTRSADFAVRGFLAAGVPANRIVLGVPFYGKGWTSVQDVNHGLYQSATGPAKVGGSYRELKQLAGTVDRKYFKKAATCTVWNNSSFWSYDCPEAMRKKMAYIRKQHLGGVMFWELSHDTADGELLRTLSH
jgi:chitinase